MVNTINFVVEESINVKIGSLPWNGCEHGVVLIHTQRWGFFEGSSKCQTHDDCYRDDNDSCSEEDGCLLAPKRTGGGCGCPEISGCLSRAVSP